MSLLQRSLAAIAHAFLRLGHSSNPCKAVDTHKKEAEKQAEKEAAENAENKLRWENYHNARKEAALDAALMKRLDAFEQKEQAAHDAAIKLRVKRYRKTRKEQGHTRKDGMYSTGMAVMVSTNGMAVMEPACETYSSSS
jgi:Na+-translocating ferredoxin:NAD+ oxidoreductase RnfC subunit